MSSCTAIIAVFASAALIAAYFILCRYLPSQPSTTPATGDNDAYLAMFSVAHDDIWWAKEHAWTIVIATLATLIAVLLVDFSKKPAELLNLLSGGLLVVAAASNLYVGRMHSDMAVARIRSAFLIQRCAPLARVVNEVVAADLTDYNRGSIFMVGLIVLTSAVGGTTLLVLKSSSLGALGAYLALLALGLGGLFVQVKLRAAREKAFSSPAA